MPFIAETDARNGPWEDLYRLAAEHGAPPWRIRVMADPTMRVVLIGWVPGFVSIPHHHPHATETFQVLSGRLGFRLDDRAELALGRGDIAIARRGEVHGLVVLGDEPLVFLATVSPNEDRADEQVDVPDRWSDWVPDDRSATTPR